MEIHLSTQVHEPVEHREPAKRKEPSENGRQPLDASEKQPLDATEKQRLDATEKQQVRELQRRDREVRAHEQAHKAAAGAHATGGPTYQFERGPDGRLYATSGEVAVDTSEVAGDPEATIRKMQQLKRAALAPADPSGADRSIAADAARKEREARAEAREPDAETRGTHIDVRI